jgi:hypothetical protein
MERDLRIIARNGRYWLAAQDVREGELLDLEGDEFADPSGNGISETGDFDFTFEFATVEAVERETENCVRIDTDQGSYGFPPDHLIETTLDNKAGGLIP